MLVKVEFRSAKVVVYPKGKSLSLGKGKSLKLSVDRVGNNQPRPDNQLISGIDCGNPLGTAENLIHHEQVSNMLAVLIGERPVSTFHTPIIDGKPIRSRIQELDEIAKNTFVKLNNIYLIESDDKKTYIGEFSTGRKSGPSNSKMNPTITWRRYRNYFIDKPENFEISSNIFQKYLKKPFNQENYGTIDEAISEIKKGESFDEFVEDLKKIHLLGFIDEGKSALRPRKNHRLSFVSQDTYPMLTLSISGEFVMEVDNEIYKRLKTGKKVATYLDGGVVTLQKWEETGDYFNTIIDEEDLYDEGFKKVKDIDIR